jgi:hypothetical protein
MPTRTITVIADRIEMARSVALYLEASLDDVRCRYLTYAEREYKLTGDLFRSTDLFVLGLFRTYGYRLRAEGLMAGGNLLANGRRVLIVGTVARGDRLDLPIYWDIATKHPLCEKARTALDACPPMDGGMQDLQSEFAAYCHAPSGHH